MRIARQKYVKNTQQGGGNYPHRMFAGPILPGYPFAIPTVDLCQGKPRTRNWMIVGNMLKMGHYKQLWLITAVYDFLWLLWI